MTLFRLQSGSDLSFLSFRGVYSRVKTLAMVVLGLFALLAVCGVAASAQVETGQIAGTVVDQTGAIVPGASVVVKNLGTNYARTVMTSSTGSYLITGLEPAIYQVTVNSGSFKPFSAKVEVTVGGHVTLDAKLSVSATVTEVEVVGEGGAQVNTQTQELSQVVDTQQMLQLPSLTRNPYDFVAISGNVSSGDSTSTSSSALGVSGGQNLTDRGVGFALNGQRETGTEILLDGVENIAVFNEGVGEDIPVDATQEYSVVTNNFPAEYGRAAGGVVNVTTKAGTNSIHGSAWEFNRLSAYTANTYGNDAIANTQGRIHAQPVRLCCRGTDHQGQALHLREHGVDARALKRAARQKKFSIPHSSLSCRPMYKATSRRTAAGCSNPPASPLRLGIRSPKAIHSVWSMGLLRSRLRHRCSTPSTSTHPSMRAAASR